MAPVRRFQATLTESISPGDRTCYFSVPNLPTGKQLDAAGCLISITFTSSLTKQQIHLKIENVPSNRITRSVNGSSLLLLSFTEFKLRQTPLPEHPERVVLAPARESADYITRVLTTGVVLNGVEYHFFGHSNSQLKSRSVFMYAGSKQVISTMVEALGDFSKLKSVGKKVKRIGLLFSSAEVAMELDPALCEDISDVKFNDYTFTDGCGLISGTFARQIAKRRNIVHRNRRYLPSVFQIRYRGYKGVLTLHPSMAATTAVQFRDSMRKFKDVKDHSFAVVEYSKPYAFGFLNDEIVLLLNSLGISSTTLLQKQARFLQFLRDTSLGNLPTAFQFLSYRNESELAEKLLLEGVNAVKGSLRRLVKDEYAKMLDKYDEQRCRIMIPGSRLLFGVCDPSAKLSSGTCFVRITNDGTGDARTLINTEVLVTRNPCLHPGDLQKFRVVDVPEYKHLVDCIVFPTCGTRPSADMMSGGDLDGDKFFVTWDPEIIPRQLSQAALYVAPKEKIEFGTITGDDRAEFFARYTNASLGRTKNLYLKWARLKGPLSPECQQLNRLFSQCVDGARIKVPANLEDPSEPSAETPAFILDMLHDAAKSFINDAVDGDSSMSEYPTDVMELLLARDKIAMSEFELIQLVLNHCQTMRTSFSDFAPYFNYSMLTDEQQSWLLSSLPASRSMPSLVKNGLLQSELLHPAEIKRFQLHHPSLHWKPVFASGMDRMGRFLQSASRALEVFHKKLIVFQPDERLTLMIYVPQKIQKASEVQVDACVRVFALPHSSGTSSVKYRVMPTKKNYRLYCDDTTFQLYELKRGNTFIFLTRGQMDKSSFVAAKNTSEKRKQQQRTLDDGTNADFRASIALDKISKPIQQHVGRVNRAAIGAAEIYVISNRDVESMRYLDAWLHFVDTDEILPLFASEPQEYQKPTLETIDRGHVDSLIAQIVFDQKYALLGKVTGLGDIQKILELLSEAGQKTRMRTVCEELLKTAADGKFTLDRQGLLHLLLCFLQSAAFLTQPLLESRLWKENRGSLVDEATSLFPEVLRQLVLSANWLQSFVRQPFKLLLEEMPKMSIQELTDLVELITLSVKEPEFAIDLLMECLEPQIIRLLDESPLEANSCCQSLSGIALDHIDEASSGGKFEEQTLMLKRDGTSDGFEVVRATLRIDLPGAQLKKDDHVRFVAAIPPTNAPLERPYTMDALVISADPGSASFRCIHRPPVYVQECSWKFKNCGSFATSKAMFDAVSNFFGNKTVSCALYRELVGVSSNQQTKQDDDSPPDLRGQGSLNESQNKALTTAQRHPLSLIWGPPGTGKTHTIVQILETLLQTFPDSRLLVTAPTHNAVDNLLQRFIKNPRNVSHKPLRVSTQLSKVSPALRAYTCDALAGKDLSADFKGRRESQKRVKASKLIFTTCVGAALGLLRSEMFDIVIVDEASQQSGPETLIPLTKGCKRAVLVGDHVQLRATVQKHAVVVGHDISLFERVYTRQVSDGDGVQRVMLDTQYRMHPDVCSFSSREFYQDRLKSAPAMRNIGLSTSQFPWPVTGARKVFIQCSGAEDVGLQSKSNKSQVTLCKRICDLLKTSPPISSPLQTQQKPDIAILTPYTRQRHLLESALLDMTVSSIDGYQGREADIVVFVTVRCNPHFDIGFLKDLRRLNVAVTRARAGIIVIGDRGTLVGGEEDEDRESKDVWRRLLGECEEVVLPSGDKGENGTKK